jgi:cyanate permease
LAFLMGLIGIAARLTVGALLDRFPGNLIGVGTLLMPLIGCAILLGGKPDALLLGIAVASFGAAIGAEVDVALYLATRHFGLRAFAALFGAVIGFGALMATAGPTIAGLIHDATGDYRMLLIIIMAVMATGALAIGLIGRKVPDWGAAAER